MSNEVAENLREIASNLLAAASRLDGIDVSADAMRADALDQCPQGMDDGWGHLGGPDCSFPDRGGWKQYTVHVAPGQTLSEAAAELSDRIAERAGTVRLDGIDVSTDAMRSGTAKPTNVPGRYALTRGVSDWVSVKCADCSKTWMDLAVDLPAGLAVHDAEHRA